MKKWKKTLIMLSIISVLCLLPGCGDGKTTASAEMNTISIKKDGIIEQTIIESFDKEYYDVDELEAKAQEKVDRYSGGTDNIVFESAQENNGKIIVKMTYKSGEYYAQFNRRDIFYGTVEELSAQGFSVNNIFSEDGTPLDDIKKIWRNHVVIIQTNKGEELDVNVYDKILYASDNITYSGKYDAIITAGDEDMVSCIVFQ